MASFRHRLVRVSSLIGILAGLIVSTSSVLPVAAASGSAYTPINPNRILDTRLSAQTLGTAGSLNLTVAGGATGVPATATGVVLNVTVTNTTASSALTVWQTGQTQNLVSNLNWKAGETRANLVNVPVGTGGQVSIFNFVGNVDVVVDEEGYFAAPSGTAGGYNALSPMRLLDTRLSAQTMNTGSVIDLQILGAGGVPATGVSAVVLNATATNTATEGFFTLYPSLTTRPLASNVNWKAGWTLPNRVIVGVGTNGKVSIYNGQGSADAVIDVSGYFTDSTASGKFFTPLNPVRVVDTRVSGGTIGPNGVDTFQVTGGSVPTGASAVFFNTTVTNTTASSALTVYPNARPLASDLNWIAGQTIPNLTLATLSGTGTLSFYNFVGSTDLVLDLSGYFGGAAAGVSVSANPTSIPANGATTSAVTATVILPNGTPAVSDPVNFTTSGGTSCGTFTTANPISTNGSGQATVTYKASTTAGTCTITATEAQGGLSGSTVITQTRIPNTVTQTATPQTMFANGTTTSAIATTVKNGATPISGDVVTYTMSGNPAAACGTLSASSGTTNASGVVTPAVTYTASLTPGFCTLTATEAGTGSSTSTVITQKGTATNSMTVSATPASIAADGRTTSVVKATVSGNGIANDLVSFTMSGATGVCGTLSAASATTDISGVASVTYTASTTAGICTVTGSEVNGGSSNTGTITQTSVANNISATATPSSIPADGATTSSVKATVTSGVTSAAVAGDTVTFTLTGGAACGTLSTATAVTDSSGLATDTYKASVTTGFCTITATDGSGGSGATTITQTSAAASSVTVTANPTSVQADGLTTSTVTATVKNSSGGPVPSDPVNFTSSGAACGTLTGSTSPTNAGGTATVTYTASTTTGTCTITATEASLGKSGSTSITQTVVKNTITQTATPSSLFANGTATSTIATTVKKGATPVNADVVSYTLSGDPAAACGTLSANSGTTNASGVVTPAIVYTASITVGFCTLTATEAGTGTSKATVITQKGTAANAITVAANPTSVPADGATTSTVTATVTGNGIANDLVSFTLSGGAACGTLSAASATTNLSGAASVTYTPSTTAGTCVVNVAEANGGSNNAGQLALTKTITQTAVNNNITATATPSTLKGDGLSTSTVTATVTTGVGATAVSGDVVTFTLSGTCGTLNSATATTDASGKATVTYTSSVAIGFCNVKATEAATSQFISVTITQTA